MTSWASASSATRTKRGMRSPDTASFVDSRPGADAPFATNRRKATSCPPSRAFAVTFAVVVGLLAGAAPANAAGPGGTTGKAALNDALTAASFSLTVDGVEIGQSPS